MLKRNILLIAGLILINILTQAMESNIKQDQNKNLQVLCESIRFKHFQNDIIDLILKLEISPDILAQNCSVKMLKEAKENQEKLLKQLKELPFALTNSIGDPRAKEQVEKIDLEIKNIKKTVTFLEKAISIKECQLKKLNEIPNLVNIADVSYPLVGDNIWCQAPRIYSHVKPKFQQFQNHSEILNLIDSQKKFDENEFLEKMKKEEKKISSLIKDREEPNKKSVTMGFGGSITLPKYNSETKRIYTFGLGGCHAVGIYAKSESGEQKAIITHYSGMEIEKHQKKLLKLINDVIQPEKDKIVTAYIIIQLPDNKSLTISANCPAIENIENVDDVNMLVACAQIGLKNCQEVKVYRMPYNRVLATKKIDEEFAIILAPNNESYCITKDGKKIIF